MAYTDGSLIDGPPYHSGMFGRLGWAFVVVDAAGAVIAAAHGVPPPWVRTIHGAELWALQMAAMHALPGTSYRTDCYSLLQVFSRGHAWATAAGPFYARIWSVVFAQVDDVLDLDLAWMPAHTKPADVGELLLSNGLALTCIDRDANAEADRLAKAAAVAHRVPASVRGRVDAAHARARELALWIGRATAAAGRSELPSGVMGRDSQPGERRTWEARPQRARCRVQQRTPELGGHVLEQRGEEWLCVSCLRSSRHWSVLAPGLCSGSALDVWARRAEGQAELLQQASKEHRAVFTGDIVWCDCCGAYASRRAKGIARSCPGKPSDRSATYRLRSLRLGRHPVTQERLIPLGNAAPCLGGGLSEAGHAAAVARGSSRWSALVARVNERAEASSCIGKAD